MHYLTNVHYANNILAAAIVYLVLFVIGIGVLIYTGDHVNRDTWMPDITVPNVIALCYVVLVYIVGPFAIFCAGIGMTVRNYCELRNDEVVPLIN